MSFVVEVLYESPSDSQREAAVSDWVSRFGGRLSFREEPASENSGPICLTFEFHDLQQAQEAAACLRQQGEHVEGPADYGDDGS